MRGWKDRLNRSRPLTATATAVALFVALIAAAVVAGRWSAPGLSTAPASAQTPPDIHGGYAATTDSCASCHRSHTASAKNLLTATGGSQSSLCLSCHNGTGAESDVAAEYSDPLVAPNDAATSSFYSHPATTPSNHTSGQQNEFAGVLNRHSECSDCHNPHMVTGAFGAPTSSGWTASGAEMGTTGVSGTGPLTWQSPVTYEYQLCLKCHSRYTVPLSYDKESYKKRDVAAEFDALNAASYHPVEGIGTNDSAAMANSLAGGKLWQLTTGDTVRCTQCHGNYRLVGDPPVSGSPAASARLAPHTSRYRGLLIAPYRDRNLKLASVANDYASTDFSLCYLCHSEAPFTDASGGARTDTNYPYHGIHLNELHDESGGSPDADIDIPGAGAGNAICAECHYRTHGTAEAYWGSQRANKRLVNFAPNVQPLPGWTEPVWTLEGRTCTLRCHGVEHNNWPY